MAKSFNRLMAGIAGLAGFAGWAGMANAAEPQPWQMGLQPAASEVMQGIRSFNSFTLVIITVITALVLALLVWCVVKFNSKTNPNPSKTSHNTLIEVVWTVAPILILVVIAIPSFRLLYKQIDVPEYDMTIKAIGYQWYWGYEYTDEGMDELSFDSIMLENDEREEYAAKYDQPITAYPRLLAVDNAVVVPVGKTIRVQVTAADVIHSFAMPAFGVKVDAVPGRLNETWFKADAPGVYYGQCSELCGKAHAFMPIAIRAVPQEQFDAWAQTAKDDVETANDELMAAIAAAKKTATAPIASTQIAVR